MSKPASNLPTSQRTAYQFPIYRWIGWLAVAAFAVGLTMMFFVAGMFGVPAPLGWAFLVVVFAFGALLLDHPKLLLGLMLFYFLLMPGDRLFGLIQLPIPDFLDELFFLPFIAVIVMNWIERRQLAEATVFPMLFCGIAVLSWYVNQATEFFPLLQVTLVTLKFYILWYYCRLTCTFENKKQLNGWMWLYIWYAVIQFPYNILWQGAPWPRFHPDRSGGVLGPMSGGEAHLVGYISILALFLIAGWWISAGAKASVRKRWGVFSLVLIIGYNLIFMTDTKHGLILALLAFAPFLFHPKVSFRLRARLISAGLLFFLASLFYLSTTFGTRSFRQYMNTVAGSPKGKLTYAVTVDFPHLVPYPLLGAGPGRFTSPQATASRAPLARRYIIPYQDEMRRLRYFGRSGSVVQASVLGGIRSDMLRVIGEYGWLGGLVFLSFYLWVAWKLYIKALKWPLASLEGGVLLSLCCCVLFLVLLFMMNDISTVPIIIFPIWILIGRLWDMPPSTALTDRKSA
ncbi:MAG: hypothetical protein LBN38_07300 [Verrucomicrobiota bacterium]|jgi:hypothetical protein|nr:hypothetical protein [Verrucomicrobiota bacterium]